MTILVTPVPCNGMIRNPGSLQFIGRGLLFPNENHGREITSYNMPIGLREKSKSVKDTGSGLYDKKGSEKADKSTSVYSTAPNNDPINMNYNVKQGYNVNDGVRIALCDVLYNLFTPGNNNMQTRSLHTTKLCCAASFKNKSYLRKKKHREQGGNCTICNNKIGKARIHDTSYVNLDHIIPRSKGGSNAASNAALTHKKCNQKKGNKLNFYLW